MRSEKNNCNLPQVCQNLQEACRAAGRSCESVSLLAISKGHCAEAVFPLLKAGQRWFGENRVQEAEAKWPLLRPLYPDLRLHLVGPLQTNKARQALGLFDVIETVDNLRLVLKLAAEWQTPQRITQKILIQVNLGREPQKRGVLPEDLPALIGLCHDHALPLTGLMAIPPVQEDPTPHFHHLAALAQDHHLTDLSMGMSQDYPAAIACGATWVRVGRALWV